MPFLKPDQALGYWKTFGGLIARIDDHYKGRFYGLVLLSDGSLRKTIWNWDLDHARSFALGLQSRKREHERWTLPDALKAADWALRRKGDFLYAKR